MLPLVQRDRPRALHANSQVGPAPYDVQPDLTIDQVEAMPHTLEIILGMGDDGAFARLRLDPGREGEGLQIIEVRGLAVGFDVTLAVEVAVGGTGLLACQAGREACPTGVHQTSGEGPIRAGCMRRLALPVLLQFAQARFEGGAADGFNVMPSYFPGELDAFAKLVVPELQRRGLFRREYDGTTLRHHLGLKRPI